jgi:hypothetical protein
MGYILVPLEGHCNTSVGTALKGYSFLMADEESNRAKAIEELREIVGENISDLMRAKKMNDRSLEALGVHRNNLNRARRGVAGSNLDTLALIARGLNVQPAVLLMRGAARQMTEVFTPPVPDSRLGDAWTRPDHSPLLKGKENAPSLRKIPKQKNKVRG